MNPDAKILIASGYSPDGALDETLDIGARQILRKPFHLNQMLKVVAEVLDAR
jgi:DNA-binding NarL/FixJ family response regulator